jgi:hypothetical protein
MRGSAIAKNGDVVNVSHWDVVDNSILFYDEPYKGTIIWIEVATTTEEFGDTLLPTTVEEAEKAARRAFYFAVLSENEATRAENEADRAERISDDVQEDVKDAKEAALLAAIEAYRAELEANRADSEADRALLEANRAATQASYAEVSANKAKGSEDFINQRFDEEQGNGDTVLENIDTITTEPVATLLAEAEQNAWEAKIEREWSEAHKLTSHSYAQEPAGDFVDEYVPDGQGGFTPVPTTNYSSYHWSTISLAASEGLRIQGVWDPNSGTDPVPADDPDNPGTPLPYANGMYWYILEDSADQVNPDPVYGGPFVKDDKIVRMEGYGTPYDPWLNLPDIINWQRIIEVPDNVRNAFPNTGGKITGNLEIENTFPSITMTDTADATGNKYRWEVDNDSDLALYYVDHEGDIIKKNMDFKANCRQLELNDDVIKYNNVNLVDTNKLAADLQAGLDTKTTGSWTFDGITLAITGVPAAP